MTLKTDHASVAQIIEKRNNDLAANKTFDATQKTVILALHKDNSGTITEGQGPV